MFVYEQMVRNCNIFLLLTISSACNLVLRIYCRKFEWHYAIRSDTFPFLVSFKLEMSFIFRPIWIPCCVRCVYVCLHTTNRIACNFSPECDILRAHKNILLIYWHLYTNMARVWYKLKDSLKISPTLLNVSENIRSHRSNCCNILPLNSGFLGFNSTATLWLSLSYDRISCKACTVVVYLVHLK